MDLWPLQPAQLGSVVHDRVDGNWNTSDPLGHIANQRPTTDTHELGTNCRRLGSSYLALLAQCGTLVWSSQCALTTVEAIAGPRLRRDKEVVDDLDKSVSFVVSEAPRRSTSSLGALDVHHRSVTYRSKKRDLPGTVRPLDWPPTPELDRNPPGSITYWRNAPDLSATIEAGRVRNLSSLPPDLVETSARLKDAIDDLYAQATEHIPLFDTFADVQPNEAWDVLVPCFHLSIVSLYVARFLTVEGFYGPAHSHLRHAFEALLVAKFCSVNPSADVYDRWIDGIELYFSNSVLKRIRAPDQTETRILWKLLCEKTHATLWSGQHDLRLEKKLDDVGFNLTIVGVLARWCAHLYAGHILTPSAAYYGRRYRRTPRTDLARQRLGSFFKWHRSQLSAGARSLISEYTHKWTVA